MPGRRAIRRGPAGDFRGDIPGARKLEDIESATLEWVDWFNHWPLLEPIGHVPPAEFEEANYRKEREPEYAGGLTEPSSGTPGAVQCGDSCPSVGPRLMPLAAAGGRA